MAEAVKSITASTYSASTGLGINYIGKHVYAFSGSYEASNTEQTVFDFTSGSGYIHGQIELFAAANFNSPGAGTQTTCQIEFNGLVINVLKNATEGGAHGSLGDAKCKVVIPPFTNVVVKVDSNQDDATELCHVIITGRLYGAV